MSGSFCAWLHDTFTQIVPSFVGGLGVPTAHFESLSTSLLTVMGNGFSYVQTTEWSAWVGANPRFAALHHPFAYLLKTALHLVGTASPEPSEHGLSLYSTIGAIVNEFEALMERLLGGRTGLLDGARRWILAFNLGCSILRGVLASGVIANGFFSIDDQEWSAWLSRYGLWEETRKSAYVRGLYDYVFGFVDGDTNQPAIAAGTCLHGFLRLALTYKGAIFFEMQAGMGDTVFAPLYTVLKRRGVQFKFFHKVLNLGVSADSHSIETITLGRQATLIPGAVEYQPLIDVEKLPCWPSVPLFEQLVEGPTLKSRKVNLESAWADWTNPETFDLKREDGFDIAVLGLSLGSFPSTCKELMASQRFKEMCDNVKTVQTQAVQLWLRPDLAGLGWDGPKPMLTSYAEPFDTWADLSHLIPREVWPAGLSPQNLAYFCGPMKDPAVTPPFNDPTFPALQLAQTRKTAIDWLSTNIGYLWPRALDGQGRFNWDLLVGPAGAQGPDRLDTQFLRRTSTRPSDT